MTNAPAKRKNWAGIAIAIAVVLFCTSVLAAVLWTPIVFGMAAVFAERRPELLRDVEWDDPTSARTFLARFPSGSRQSELIDWLEANEFEIDTPRGEATRAVHGFPCTELINVTWSSDSAGNLAYRQVVIPPGGCL